MSIIDYKLNRLNKHQARKLIFRILKWHLSHVYFSGHARRELKKDHLTTEDALNVLRSPSGLLIREPEFENGSWRYRVETKKIAICVAFDSADVLIIVTAWRKGSL